jgi:ABC-type branched-subunit amino acid transport system substrate-binding protein
MVRSRHAMGLVCTVACCSVLLLAGCSSSSSSSVDSAGSSSAPAGSSASGSPVKIMATSILSGAFAFPETVVGAKAAVDAINASGGVSGHPIDLVTCDNKYDPNTEVDCARDAQSDGVAAMIGVTDFNGTFAVLNSEKIPFVGGFGTASAELISPIAFPLAGSIPGYSYGAAAVAAQLGAKNPVVLATTANGQAAAQYFINGMTDLHGITPREVTFAAGLPDYTATVAQVLSKPVDALYVVAIPNDLPKIITALRAANYKGAIICQATILGDSLKTLGAAANGIYAVGDVAPYTSPNAAQFLADVKKIDPNAENDVNSDEFAIQAWASVELWAKVAATIHGTINAASTLAAFNDLKTPVTLGVTEPYDTSDPSQAVKGVTRLFNPYMAIDRIINEKFEQQGTFVNVFVKS